MNFAVRKGRWFVFALCIQKKKKQTKNKKQKQTKTKQRNKQTYSLQVVHGHIPGLWFGMDPGPISTLEVRLDIGKEMSLPPSIALVWHNHQIGLLLTSYKICLCNLARNMVSVCTKLCLQKPYLLHIVNM